VRRVGVAEVVERQVAELRSLALEAGERLQPLAPVEIRVGQDEPAAPRASRKGVKIRQLVGVDGRHGDRLPGQPERQDRAAGPPGRCVPVLSHDP
jgi:hypothetical protein